MKKVALDLQPCVGNRAGIGTYTYEIARRIRGDGMQFCGHVFARGALPELEALGLPLARCGKFPYGVYRRVWHLLPLSYEKLFPDGADLKIFFDYIVPPRVAGKVISVVHDMTYKRFPETMLARNRRRIERDICASVERSDRVVTVSRFSADEIVQLLGVPREKICIVFNAPAAQAEAAPRAALEERFGLKGEYILYVGTIEARKNLDFLLRAFDRFKRETGLPHKLVLAGGDGWENRAVYERAASVSCAADIRFLGYVSGPVKSALYDNASLFVFPSLYEGFGIPPLEAMEHGCPVVCSDAASLPEVVGDAALTVGVSDEVGLAGAMHRVLTDASLAHSLAERGRARARAFSWDDSAAKLAAVCHSLLGDVQ